MKKTAIMTFLLAFCFITAAESQTAPKPAPAPEWQQLQGVLGRWTYTCDYKATPWSPALSTTGEYTNEMILDGFFLKGHWDERASGGMEGYEILRYEPENKSFVFSGYMSNGGTYQGTTTIKGTTQSTTQQIFSEGKQYFSRYSITYSGDWASAAWKAEVSVDGKTWVPFFEQKMTKVKTVEKN